MTRVRCIGRVCSGTAVIPTVKWHRSRRHAMDTERHARSSRRLIALLSGVAVLVLGLGAGSAYASFTSAGSGSGSGSTGTAKSITLEAANGTPSSTLIPGGIADLLVELQNPNPYPLSIVAISQNGSVTAVGGNGPGTPCSTSNAGVSVPTQTGLNITVAAGDHVVVHIASGISMDAGSASGCQAASFQIPINLTVEKQ